MFFAIPFLVTLTHPDPFVITPDKHRIKATLIGCIDVDGARGMQRLRELSVRLVFEEFEPRCRSYLVWKHHDDTHVRGAGLRMGIMERIFDMQVTNRAPSHLDHFARILLGMLVQITKSCRNRTRGRFLPPAQ